MIFLDSLVVRMCLFCWNCFIGSSMRRSSWRHHWMLPATGGELRESGGLQRRAPGQLCASLGLVAFVRCAKHGRHGASMAMVMANYVKDAAAQDRAKAVGAAPVLALLVELLHSLEVQAVVVEDDHVPAEHGLASRKTPLPLPLPSPLRAVALWAPRLNGPAQTRMVQVGWAEQGAQLTWTPGPP